MRVQVGGTNEGPPTLSRGWAAASLVGALLLPAAGLLAYRVWAPTLPDLIAIELNAGAQGLPPTSVLQSALAWDLVVILGYGLGLFWATWLARQVCWTPRAQALARFAQGATVAAVVTDLLENLFLYLALQQGTSWWQPWLRDAAAGASTVKWVSLVPAVVIAVTGLLATATRLAASGRPRPDLKATTGEPVPLGPETLVQPRPIEQDPTERATADRRGKPARGRPGMRDTRQGDDGAEARWGQAFVVPDISEDDLRSRTAGDEVIGFCLSGGGIRSGSVAMGVLQVLREELRRARYLVSVSGGGYTAGAFAQVLTDADETDTEEANRWVSGTPIRDPDTAFLAGSPELDHVRRHSSYIASTAAELLVALGVLARGLLVTLALAFAPAFVLGVAAAYFYRQIPFAVLPVLRDDSAAENTADVGSGLQIPGPAVIAVLVLLLVALVAWLIQIGAFSTHAMRATDWWRRASVFLTRLNVVVAAAAIGVPIVVWASGQVVEMVGASAGTAIGGSVTTVVLTFFSSVATLSWRHRKTIKDVTSGQVDGTKVKRKEMVPNGLLQQLLVIVSIALLLLSWLLLFGVTTIATATNLTHGTDTIRNTLLVGVGIVVFVVVAGGLFDESSLSLHPFYRARLASAFAVRRVRSGRDTVAAPYDPREPTTLSRYGRAAASAQPFPSFVFAAAAHLTGENRTPPGLTAASFTMTADWVGGPDVGYVRTRSLEEVCSKRLESDVTVQAAVAISGAAFASAMGRMASWYQLLLTLSGARLGAWLPNPVFLARIRAAHDDSGRAVDWTVPGLPSVRRATYLLRELFNLHPYHERLLFVTDGGHYENLGLVEALRRRCTTIYCVDGGGDRPPTAPGLAQALALAESELGVTVTLDRPFDAEPGAGGKLKPEVPLAKLNAALTENPIITGTITYPAASGLPEHARTGRLYVARALLWPTMPYPLLSYAAKHDIFPHDSTGDQWFEDGQFTAYTHLGRELGLRLRAAVEEDPAAHARPALPQGGERRRGQGRRLSPWCDARRKNP